MCDSAAETPIRRESDSTKKRTLEQASGARRQNRVRVWLREARGEAAGHSGKPSPDPAGHATSQTAIMQDSCPQPDCCSAGNGHAAGGMPFASAAALLDREVTPTLDPMAVRAEGCAGWERRGEGGVSVKASAGQGWPWRCPYLPCNRVSISSSFLSCPSLLPAAVPARSCFSGPTSLRCQCSETPSQPLCTQLCPAASPCVQGLQSRSQKPC